MTSPIPAHKIIRYSLPAMALSFAGIPLYIYAPDFYSNQQGIPLGLLGIALLVLRLIDAFQDPLIGHLSDRFQHKQPSLILMSLILLGVSFTLLFNPLEGLGFIWFCTHMFLATTAYSILSINLYSLGSRWQNNSVQTTRIIAYREGIAILGLLLAVLLPPIFALYTNEQHVFSLLSLVLCVCALIGFVGFLSWTRSYRNVRKRRKKSPLNLWENIRHAPKKTRRFFIITFCSFLASSIPAVLIIFFVRDYLGLYQWLGAFLLLYFISALIGIPFWKHISQRLSKDIAWKYAMLLAIISFGFVLQLQPGDGIGFGIICILTGIALGADLIMPHSILSDLIQQNNQEQQTSTQYSFLTFILKGALAGAAILTLPMLEYAEFTPNQTNDAFSLLVLLLSYTLIPCILKSIACYLLHQFSKNQQHKERLRDTKNIMHYRSYDHA